MFDLINTIVKAVVGLVTGGGSADQPDPSDPCNATQCVDAKEQLAGERKTFTQVCYYAQVLDVTTTLATGMTATPLWLIAVLIAVAVLVPILAPFILVFLAAYAFAWYLVIFVLPKVNLHVAQALLTRQEAVNKAIAEVVTNCPEQCRGDISSPECRLDAMDKLGR